MKVRALLLSAALVVCLMPFAFGQGSASPAQPQDPTAQSPAANPPATPKTFPDSTQTGAQPADQTGSQSSAQSSQSGSQSGSSAQTNSTESSATSAGASEQFTGSIIKSGGKYQLRSAGNTYDLDDQSQAKNFAGKDVKVNGSLDKASNTIKVASIEPASSM